MREIWQRRPTTGAFVLLLLALPAVLLAPALFGDRVYLPYDLAQFPPAATMLTAEQLERITAQQNMDVTEVPATFVPELQFAQQELRDGRLPHWNPYARGGAPLLATSVVGLLYPPNWPTLLLGDPMHGLALGAWLSFAIAGLLAYGFLRELGLRQQAALFGAIVFAFGGTMAVNGHFYQRIAALAWLPGQLWAILRLAHRNGHGRVPSFVGLAVASGMSWLAGFPPYAAASMLVAAGFALVVTCADLRRSGWQQGRGPALRALAWSGGGLAVGFAIAGAQLLPMFAFFPESNRTVTPDPDALAAQSLSGMALLGYLVPDAFGHPTLTSRLPYELSPLAWSLFDVDAWGSGRPLQPNYNFSEYTLFAGTLPLLLLPAGLLLAGSRLRLGLGLLALALLLLAIAPWPVSWISALPGLRNVPPMRFSAPLALLVAALAAIGLERILDGWQRRIWLGITVTAGLCAVVLLGISLWFAATPPQEWIDAIAPGIVERYRPVRPDADVAAVHALFDPYAAAGHAQALGAFRYGALAFGIACGWLLLLPLVRERRLARKLWLLGTTAATTVQLLLLAYSVNICRELPFPLETDVHAFLRERRDRFREQGGFMVARVTTQQASLPIALPPCTLVPQHIRDLNIYTFVDGRSHLPFAQEWLGPEHLIRGFTVGALPDDPAVLGHPYLDLLGVRYLLTTDRLAHAGPPVGPQLRNPARGAEFYVHERRSALPRAFLVPALRELPDEQAVIAALVDPQFDPRAAVLVTGDQVPSLGSVAPAENLDSRNLRFLAEHPTEITLAFDPGPPCYVVLADTWMSGWSASINGEPVPIARGNLWMRTLPLPARGGELRFRYETPGLRGGLALTAGALGLLLLLMLSYLTTRRQLARSERAA